MREKITESLKLHLPESLKRVVQDDAMEQDRTVSDTIRHVLMLHYYGKLGGKALEGKGTVRGDEGHEP